MRTIYTSAGSLSRPTIISETEFADRVTAIDAVRLMNRESDNRQNHTKNVVELEAAHNRLGLQEPFAPFLFHGSGCLRFLKDIRWEGRYFRELRDLIENGLRQTKGMLYVIVPFIERLLRPFRYDQHADETWTLLESDYQILWEWMVYHFKHRAKDVVFVVLFEGTPGEVRGIESTLGMQQSGNMGGKPPKVKKTRINKIMREYLQMLTVFLLENGRNVQQIRQHFENRDVTVSERAIQKWAKKHGLNRRRGKPNSKATLP